MSLPRVDVVVSFPGPAEALAPVLRHLEGRIELRIRGLSRTPVYNNLGGSYDVFLKDFPDADDLAPRLARHNDLESLVRADPPDLFLLGAVNDLDGSRLFPEKDILALARDMGIPTLQFVDNWMAWSVNSQAADLYLNVDDLCAEVGKKLNPAFSRHLTTGHPGLQAFLETMRGPDYGHGEHIGFFTQTHVDTGQVLDWLQHILGPEDSLLVKKHPRDDTDPEPHLRRFACPAKVTPESPEVLYPSLSHCITHTSVVGLKAALLSIPTTNVTPGQLMLQVGELLGGYPLALAGLTREANTLEELRQAIREPLVPDPIRVREHFRLDDAAQRMAGAVLDRLA